MQAFVVRLLGTISKIFVTMTTDRKNSELCCLFPLSFFSGTHQAITGHYQRVKQNQELKKKCYTHFFEEVALI